MCEGTQSIFAERCPAIHGQSNSPTLLAMQWRPNGGSPRLRRDALSAVSVPIWMQAESGL